MRYSFRLPDVGEGIHEAEIVSYEVNVGDEVKADQVIIKIETDKAVVTLPAPADGKIVEIPLKPGDIVSVGDPLIIIETEAEIAEEVPEEPVLAESATTPAEIKIENGTREAKMDAAVEEDGQVVKRVLATPHTRHLARELNMDIKSIKGTGSHGKVIDDDVRRAAKQKPTPPPKIPRAAAVEHKPSTQGFDFEKYGATRREPLTGIRKRIAEVMVRSYSTIPHVSHTDEVDVTELFHVVKKQKTIAEEKGVKLTITAFVVKAVISALQNFPEVNSSLDEESGEIVYKDYYHIGIAMDTKQGLMVPVVRDVDQKTILQIAKDIQTLAEKARNREIDLEELRGGTFTITNIGSIGGIHATPIINHPQLAILGTLAARKKPVVKDDEIDIRTMMPLVVSFDHRLLDGAMMARFMNHIVQLLQDPMKMLVEVV